jgi:transposase
MAHLHKKIKKGKPYYYIRETQRINGKPTVVSQVYVGSPDRILALATGSETSIPSRVSVKEFGSVFVMEHIDRKVGLCEIVDSVIPRRKSLPGPSTGDLLSYAVINRAVSPKSKRALSKWYERTDIQSIRPVALDSLSPQNFWNQWEKIGEKELREIMERFFSRVRELSGATEEHFLFDTTNYYTYLSSRTKSDLAKRGHNKAGKHFLRQVGLALAVGRQTSLPLYAAMYPGNEHDASFFNSHLDEIIETLKASAAEDITLIFDKGMNAEESIARIDLDPGLHFITSYSPYFAPELASIPLSRFDPLPAEKQPKDAILYHDTRGRFWGKERRVIITFNPKTYRKKRYDLKEKLTKLREELFYLRRAYRQRHPHSKTPSQIRERYERICESLHVSANLFELSFFEQDDRPAMGFDLNTYQVDALTRKMAKVILVTDHLDWSPVEIYRAYRDRHLIEDHFKSTKDPFQIAFMPQYHWTDSKIRIHGFVCIAALTYMTMLGRSLKDAGLTISTKEAMEELRNLRTAIFFPKGKRKPERLLEEPTEKQVAILSSLGFKLKGGRVLQK